MPLTLVNRPAVIPSIQQVRGTGWLPPPVDPRDFTAEAPAIADVRTVLETKLEQHRPEALAAPPVSVDLRPWCSPIEDQGGLGSCTANAAMGVVEYFERRAHGKHIDGSRLFVYKTTRNLMGVTGDTGAWLRNAMGTLATCGVPHERYWPYTDADPAFDLEPSAFVYAVADDFEALQYFAHDPLSLNVPRPAVVASVKKYLAAGIPSMFGFWGYASFDRGDQPGNIPVPTDAEVAGDPAWATRSSRLATTTSTTSPTRRRARRRRARSSSGTPGAPAGARVAMDGCRTTTCSKASPWTSGRC